VVMADICEVCGRRGARYVCSRSGCRVCEECFDKERWACARCLGTAGQPVIQPLEIPQPRMAVTLFIASFFTIFLGMMLMTLSAVMAGGATASGGAVVFIGPIPIILGAGQNPLLAIGLAAILTVIAVVLFLATRRAVRVPAE